MDYRINIKDSDYREPYDDILVITTREGLIHWFEDHNISLSNAKYIVKQFNDNGEIEL